MVHFQRIISSWLFMFAHCSHLNGHELGYLPSWVNHDKPTSLNNIKYGVTKNPPDRWFSRPFFRKTLPVLLEMLGSWIWVKHDMPGMLLGWHWGPPVSFMASTWFHSLCLVAVGHGQRFRPATWAFPPMLKDGRSNQIPFHCYPLFYIKFSRLV